MVLLVSSLILFFTPYQALRQRLGVMTVVSFVVYSITAYILQKIDPPQIKGENINSGCLKKVEPEIKINVDSTCGKILWIVITLAVSLLYLSFTFYVF
jgi:hypothetical protein